QRAAYCTGGSKAVLYRCGMLNRRKSSQRIPHPPLTPMVLMAWDNSLQIGKLRRPMKPLLSVPPLCWVSKLKLLWAEGLWRCPKPVRASMDIFLGSMKMIGLVLSGTYWICKIHQLGSSLLHHN